MSEGSQLCVIFRTSMRLLCVFILFGTAAHYKPILVHHHQKQDSHVHTQWEHANHTKDQQTSFVVNHIYYIEGLCMEYMEFFQQLYTSHGHILDIFLLKSIKKLWKVSACSMQMSSLLFLYFIMHLFNLYFVVITVTVVDTVWQSWLIQYSQILPFVIHHGALLQILYALICVSFLLMVRFCICYHIYENQKLESQWFIELSSWK